MKRKHWKSSTALLLSALIVSSNIATLTASAQSADESGMIPAEEVNIPLLGDANGDGKINISDATAIQRHVAEMTLLNDEYLEAADVDGDGEITETDATLIQKYLASIETPYLIGQPIKVVLGDANGDGKINNDDVTAIQRHILGTELIADRYQRAADINGSDGITSADAVLLQDYINGTDIGYPMGEEVLDPLKIESFSSNGYPNGVTGVAYFSLNVSGAKLQDDKLKSATIVIEQYGKEVATVDYLAAKVKSWSTDLKGIFTATITVTDWADRTATATDTFEIQGAHFAKIDYETDTETGAPMVGTPIVFNYEVVDVASRYAHYSQRQITVKKNGEEIEVVSDTYQANPLVWTPTEAGRYDLTFEMTGYGGGHAVKTIVIDVYDTLSASLSLDKGDGSGVIPYGKYIPTTVSVSGGKAPYTYEVTHNSANTNADMFFTSTANAEAEYPFTRTITAQDSSGSFRLYIGHPTTYKVDVKITDALGQSVTKTLSLQSINLGVQNVTFSKEGAQAGETIRIGAYSNNMGSVNDSFRYTVKGPDGQTTTLIPSSRYAQVDWTPKTAGEYTVTAVLVYGQNGWGETISTKEVTYTVQESDLDVNIDVPTTVVPSNFDVLVNASAVGGTGQYQYRFGYKDENGSDVIVQNFSTKDFAVLKLDEGNYSVFVEAKDSTGTVKRNSVAVSSVDIGTFSTSCPEETTVGKSTELTAQISTSQLPVNYQFVIKGNGKVETLKADDSAASTYWTPAKEGEYTITAKALFNGKVIASKEMTCNVNKSNLTADITVDKNTVPVYNAVGIDASAEEGDGSYEYKFSYVFNGNEILIKDFSANTHADFTPSVTGSYLVKVTAKDHSGTTSEATKQVNVVSLSIATLTASTSEANVGDKVTFAATSSTDAVPVTFEYTATLNGETEALTDGEWTPKTAGSYVVKATMLYNGKAVQSKTMAYTVSKKTPDNLATIYYKGNSTMIQYKLPNGEWSTPVKLVRVSAVEGVTHKYVVNMGSEKSVEVRFCTSKGVLEDNNGLNFTFNPGLYTVVDGMITTMKNRTMLNNNTLATTANVSAKNAAVGQAITLSADSTGATGTCKYTFAYKKADAAAWTNLQYADTNNSIEFLPDTAGTYYFCIKATDDSGVAQKQYFSLKVFESIENTSALSAESIKLDESVTVNASATGGSGKYVYTVYYKKTNSPTGKWTKAQAASTNATVDITFAAAVQYDVKVVVKDTVTKETSEKVLTVKVTK